jgi:hypothetical protein
MRNGVLMVLLVLGGGCQHDRNQFEPTHCRWGSASDEEVEAAKAAYGEFQAFWEKALKGPENPN